MPSVARILRQSWAEHNKQIAADQIEQKVGEFFAAARALDAALTVPALGAFRRLACDLSLAGRLRQPSYAARDHLIKRMLGETVYRQPFPTWSEMAQAWIVTNKAA